MTTFFLDIPVIFGLSIEVYFILLIIAIPTFYFWRWLFKKFIKVDKTRKIWTWLATFFLTPCIYVGLVSLWIFSISYYPKHDFDRQKWFNEKDNVMNFLTTSSKAKCFWEKQKKKYDKSLATIRTIKTVSMFGLSDLELDPNYLTLTKC